MPTLSDVLSEKGLLSEDISGAKKAMVNFLKDGFGTKEASDLTARDVAYALEDYKTAKGSTPNALGRMTGALCNILAQIDQERFRGMPLYHENGDIRYVDSNGVQSVKQGRIQGHSGSSIPAVSPTASLPAVSAPATTGGRFDWINKMKAEMEARGEEFLDAREPGQYGRPPEPRGGR